MNRCFAALIVVVFMLAACGQPSTQTLPTLIPTPGGVQAQPTETEAVVATVQPTQEPLTRPTFPPTWTPSAGGDTSTDNGSGTDSAAPTTPPGTPIPIPTEQPTLVVCGGFVADRARSTSSFTLGTTPQIFWTKVDTAFRYRIRLLDDTGAELFVDFSLDPTYTFKADLFERGKVYAWSVYPEDSIGQQMCGERGAELLPQ